MSYRHRGHGSVLGWGAEEPVCYHDVWHTKICTVKMAASTWHIAYNAAIGDHLPQGNWDLPGKEWENTENREKERFRMKVMGIQIE